MSAKKTTPEFKEAYLSLLGQNPNHTIVCRLLQIEPVNVRSARKRDPEFDKLVLEAIEAGYDTIEEEARRRAVDGVLEPIYYKGEQVMDKDGNPAGIRKYSDFLLDKLLKGYKPKRFNPGAKFDFGKGNKVSMTFNLEGDAE